VSVPKLGLCFNNTKTTGLFKGHNSIQKEIVPVGSLANLITLRTSQAVSFLKSFSGNVTICIITTWLVATRQIISSRPASLP
jgi:hypothetical protein